MGKNGVTTQTHKGLNASKGKSTTTNGGKPNGKGGTGFWGK